MAPKTSAKRRRQNRPSGLSVYNSVALKPSTEVLVSAKEIELLPDRNFRMMRVSASFTAEDHPCVVQIRLYGPDGKAVYASPIKLAPCGKNITIRCHWPRSTDWFSDNFTGTILTIRNSCPSSNQGGGTVTCVFTTHFRYGPDIDERACKSITDQVTSLSLLV